MPDEDIEGTGTPGADQQQTETQPQADAPPAAPRVIDGIEIPADLSTVEDPDLREYYEAKVAAADEEAAAAAGKEPDPAAAEPPKEQPAKADGKPEQGKPADQPMIPKARLDEVLQKQDRLAQEAAYWRGVAEARAAAGKPAEQPGQPPAPVETPEQKMAAIRAEQDALAEKFDAGEIGMKEFKAQDRALADREMAIREEMLLAKMPKPQAAPAQQPAEDLYLAEQTARIEQEHPYVGLVFPAEMPKDGGVLAARQSALSAEAKAAVVAENPGIQAGPRADLLLRAKLAELSDRYGPIWFPDAQVGKPAGQGGQPGKDAPLTRTQQQRLDKMLTASQQPADINGVGTQGSGAGQYTEADIMKMSEDQIADLPAAVRARFTGESLH